MSRAAEPGHPALAEASPTVLWHDVPDRPDRLPAVRGRVPDADLVVVGGGYTGLWTALRAVERTPGIRVALVEAGVCGHEASSRNGGFAAASLTHGFANGLERWPDEIDTLDRLGADNLTAIGETIARLGLECHWETTGELTVATAPHQVDELAEAAAAMAAHGHAASMLDAAATRARVDSPTYLGGLLEPTGVALVEPARLAWGLRRACLESGVTIYEGTEAVALEGDGDRVVVRTRDGSVRGARIALATNAFPPLLRRLRLSIVPVYDHVLATEPLTPAQRAAIGWAGREGLADSANQFHYYRLTHDDRILWGGYDAVYHFGSRIDRALEQSPTHDLLAAQFFETFPQLAGLRFSHRWGGVIDTCTRFCAFYGTAHGGRTAYALGYTGLGVAATRFGADVMLDLLEGQPTERTELAMVREKPLPFPPEPARWLGVTLTRRALDAADRHHGRRNLWLRTLDRLGLGFDS